MIMEAGNIRLFKDRRRAVEEIERQELRAMTVGEHWQKLTKMMGKWKCSAVGQNQSPAMKLDGSGVPCKGPSTSEREILQLPANGRSMLQESSSASETMMPAGPRM